MLAGNEHLTAAIDLLDRARTATTARPACTRSTCASSGVPVRVDRRQRRPAAPSTTTSAACELIRSEENGPEFVGTLVALWGYYTARGDLAQADGLLDDIVATGITDDPVYAARRTARRGAWCASSRATSPTAELELPTGRSNGVPDAVQDTARRRRGSSPTTRSPSCTSSTAWPCGSAATSPAFREHIRRGRRTAPSGCPLPHGPFNVAVLAHLPGWVLPEIGEYDHAAARAEVGLRLDRGPVRLRLRELAGSLTGAIAVPATARVRLGDAELACRGSMQAVDGWHQRHDADDRLLDAAPVRAHPSASLTARRRRDEAVGCFDQALVVADETGSRLLHGRDASRGRGEAAPSALGVELRRAAELPT